MMKSLHYHPGTGVRADHVLLHERKVLDLVFDAEPGLHQDKSLNVDETDPLTSRTLSQS